MKENIPDELPRDYLKGKLTATDRENFEKLLDDNPDLAAEVARLRAEMAVSELLIASESRDLFKKWQAETPPPRWTFGIKPGFWWAAGIALTLLLSASIWMINRADTVLPDPALPPAPSGEETVPEPAPVPAVKPPVADAGPAQPVSPVRAAKDNPALAARYLADPMLSNFRRSPADSLVSTFNRAQEAYAAGDYRKTLDLLAQTDSARLQSATFLSAHALFRLGQFAEAETSFSRLVAWKSRQYRYLAEWGVLMCRLAEFSKQEKEFRQQLNDILAKPAHPYFEQAKDLQKEMLNKQ